MKTAPTYNNATLLILDGWGDAPASKYNAIKMAKTPTMDFLYKHSYHTLLDASGTPVGLPRGIIGNSEVGHTNIGAGKVVIQEVLKINNAIENGSFFHNPVLLAGIANATTNMSDIHIIGLVSDAMVHSSLKHLLALIKLCADYEMHENVYIHVITDGRDTDTDASFKYITTLLESMNRYKTGKIATVCGRYYAMDRDERWDRIKRAYDAMIEEPNATSIVDDVFTGIRESYNKGNTDEFIIPFRIANTKGIKENDTVIFFNFREDRARELSEVFCNKNFNGFDRRYFPLHFITMTSYGKDVCENIAFEPDTIFAPISRVISEAGFSQFKIAETEKYAHVTYFFNGGREIPYPGEDRFLIPSLKIATYDLQPQMKVFEITDELTKRIKTNTYKLLVANFANADMVGHSGSLPATIKACEYVDECISKVVEATNETNSLLIVTADHGNAEVKYNPKTKEVSTKHTTNPVPFLFCAPNSTTERKLQHGKLADIAPTILNALGLNRSFDMTGNNLVE
jgi:2,3-bisphosphoglycerate-independent phosphoglycerate mutase